MCNVFYLLVLDKANGENNEADPLSAKGRKILWP